MSPIYKLSLPSPDSADLPLFQISKPNPNAAFWSMFYFAYAGHNIPPKRIEFGKIQKNPPGQGGGGTRISITGKTAEEKAVWQTLGEGNEDCVEWVVLCAALNLLEYVPFLSRQNHLTPVILCSDEILKAAEKNPALMGRPAAGAPAPHRSGTAPPQGVGLRDPGPAPPGPVSRGPPPQQRPPGPIPGPSGRPPHPQQVFPPPGPPRGFPPNGQQPHPPPPNGHPQHLHPPPQQQGYPNQARSGPPLGSYPPQVQPRRF